jgi:exodeoxyribonuclease VII small subunit
MADHDDLLFTPPQPPAAEPAAEANAAAAPPADPAPGEAPAGEPPAAADATEPTAPRKRRKREPEAAPLTFETALARLEAVVAEMESGQLSLEECLRKFEEGTTLAAFCTQNLQAVEQKVEILLRKGGADEGGTWQEFKG